MTARDDETLATNRFADVPFAVAAFVGSSLLFVVQPIIAKQLLPTLGGAPAVWTTCVLFFQFALLVGYAWAHLGPRWLGDRRHAVVHAVLLLVACAFLPLGIARGWQPSESAGPIANVLGVLARSIGVPMCVLAATSPLIQRWHVAANPNRGDRVYRLYAIGNVASLIVLLAYPLAIEPTMTLRAQLVAWSIGFVALAVLLLTIGWRLRRVVGRREGQAAADGDASPPPPEAAGRWRPALVWLALSAVPSSLLLGVTSYLTSDVAAMPFLWVAPLALYLGAFSLAFAGYAPWTPLRRGVAPGLAVSCLLLAGLTWSTLPLAVVVALQLAAFFLLSWAILATLYDRRPAGAGLTGYYLWIAVGGVVGGAFNSLAAPTLYDTVIEYPLGMLVAAAIALACPDRRRATPAAADRRATFGSGLIVALLVASAVYAMSETRIRLPASTAATVALLVVPAAICLLVRAMPVGAGVLPAVAATSVLFLSFGGEVRSIPHRSFFGVHRVSLPAQAPFIELWHGTTVHGLQALDPRTGAATAPDVPLTYYHRRGPLGEAMAAAAPARIGVVGLGAGTLAAYADAGRSLTFYEIDPVVIRLANGGGPFTYVSAARSRGADVRIVEGDARLTLARDDGTFDLLAIDAFSGDAIPAHLLTREAFALYGRRLAPGGTLAVHVSNRYLDLTRVVAAGAHPVGGQALIGDESKWTTYASPLDGFAASTWVLITRDPTLIDRLTPGHWVKPPAARPGDEWTDDFSDLLRTLR